MGHTLRRQRRYHFLKRLAIVFGLVLILFSGYVIIVNRNSKQMTIRQQILKAVYPALMWWRGKSSSANKVISNRSVVPPVSFYSLKDTMINGAVFDFAQLKGKKVMIVNTASDCGFTNQYEALETLFSNNMDKLVVIGFPANDFKEQEKGTDDEIAQFCKKNFGISFPLMKKSSVIKGQNQNPVFSWLTDSTKNGWNKKQPVWNFSKYLVNEHGVLTNYFAPDISPDDDVITKALQQ